MFPSSVLIVENDVPFATELRDRITRLGYSIFGDADTGEAALRKVAIHRPDVALVELGIPGGLTGVKTGNRLMQMSGIPVIFTAVNSETNPFDKSCGQEPFGFLVRPFEDLELHCAIITAISRRRMERALQKIKERLEKDLGRRASDLEEAMDLLGRQEAFSRTLIAHLPQKIFVKDTNSVYLMVNDLYAQDFGIESEDFIGKDDFAFYPRDLADKYRADDRDVMDRGTPKETEENYIVNDKTFWVRTIKVPLKDPGGRVRGLLGVFWDITRRKEAEIALVRLNADLEGELRSRSAALASSEKRFRELVETTSDWIWETNEEGIYTYVSPKVKDLLGYAPEEVLGQTPFHFMPGGEAERIHPRFSELSLRRQPFKQMEVVFFHKGGQRVTVETSAVPLIDGQGHLEGYRGIDRDITERKQAEQMQRRLTAILEATPDFIGTASADGVGIYINQSGRKMLGMDPSEDVSRLRIPDVHPAWAKKILTEEGLPTAIRDGVWMGESAILSREGREIPVSQVILAHKDRLGGVEFLSTIARDITGRKRAEAERMKLQEQFIHAQKMESVGRLAGGVAHDFNNMLSVILGNVDLALLDIDASDKTYENLREIRRAGQRSVEIVRQLLAFARRQPVAPRKLNLNDVITASLKMIRRLIGEEIELAWLPQSELEWVNIDPSQIDQILANLAVNARDAIAGVGKIVVETANVTLDDSYRIEHPGFVPGRYIMLAISDTGCGMERAVLDHLFEPFFTTKDSGKGTGLGLATVYGIVKQNQGFIYVDSESGKGTTFRIYLPPCSAETPDERVSIEVRPAPTKGETLLLVEDEPSILTLIQSSLERLGYTVLTAGGPQDAIARSESHKGEIHLLITDVVMPEMTGRDMVGRLRLSRPNLKCLFMSGYPANVIDQHGVLEEGIQFLQKPFTIKDLAPKVRMILDSE